MSVNKNRGLLHWLARLLGDWQALRSAVGKDGQKSGVEGSWQDHGKGVWEGV